MKSSKLIMGGLAALGLTAGMASAQAEVDRDAIAERLTPVGQLCLQGEECGTAAAASENGDAAAGGADGEAIYNRVCMACHESGAAGAPVRGDTDAWAERVDQGFDTLLDHSINGIGAMPARGGNPNLSDEEMEAVTAYLLEPVMDVPDVAAEQAPADEAADDEGTAQDAAAADEEAATDDDAAAAADEEAATDDDAAADEEAATDDDAAADEEAAGGDADIDGEAIYNQACMACHMTGAAGAPRLGEAGEWEGRIDQDMATLYDHAINGIGAMPPKGGNTSLSDDEVRAAVDFLVESVR
ncbi:c-type cytochrome [Halomonas heilongjiangensis]|uniref:Cytochrome c5 family protein n=1 Tax=Halomonas heilongjiangensis TaxID=1387883 RepID=A0A2N7TSP8_9GAMM|nr:c-type cytochrome [Halomonas heilongjiangensis]PMR71220.1 cytochrome c5 family protein [Halomonas heilongjiangensis]PXX92930.1 cytochrome c5 family protein [Halomonas heilongjiangensis]